MQALVDRIREEGEHIGRGIIKVDGFINHQLDPALTMGMGEAFVSAFEAEGVRGVTKIVTAEVSGIAPALATAHVLGVKMVYARKHRPVTMAQGTYEAEAPSPTKGGVVNLMVSPQYLTPDDRVLLIDDFLASGVTIGALVGIIQQCGATLCGIGCVVEKAFQNGRSHLAQFGVPVVTLAKIDLDGDKLKVWS